MTRKFTFGQFASSLCRIFGVLFTTMRLVDSNQQAWDLVIVRSDLGRTFEQRDCLLNFALCKIRACVEIMRLERFGIEHYSLFELGLRFVISLPGGERYSSRRVRFSQLGVQRKCLLRCGENAIH